MEDVFNKIFHIVFLIVGGTISTFYNHEKSYFLIEKTLFISNIGDFGCALNFENRGGFIYVIDCLFDRQANPTHPIGAGSIIKTTGDHTTKLMVIRVIAKNTYSAGAGLYGLYKGNLTDINSTYISINYFSKICEFYFSSKS